MASEKYLLSTKGKRENEMQPPRWLEWAREIQALAQTGMHYATEGDYHGQRYQRLMEIAAEMVHEHSGIPTSPLVAAFRAEPGYATPKVDVRAAVFQDGRLLMVRERCDGGWTLPGGWADVGDVPSEAAERETWEEAGFRVRARKLIGVYDGNRVDPLQFNHCFKLVFLCNLIDGTPTPSRETSEVAFFAMEDIPAHLSGQRTLPRHILDAFESRAQPERPTVFD